MKNSSRIWLEREVRDFAKSIEPNAIVLDAGAGEQPYRRFFEHCRYEAADFEKVDKPYAKSTYVCDIADIPVANERFDAILFNQVLEHLPDPPKALEELNRCLKAGGRIMCSAPLFYEEHEKPYDFFRYTQFAWRRLLGDAGFAIERLDWLEGYFGTVGYQLDTMSRFLPLKPADIARGARGWLSWPLVVATKIGARLLAPAFYKLDERVRWTERGYPKNYVVIATKPASAAGR